MFVLFSLHSLLISLIPPSLFLPLLTLCLLMSPLVSVLLPDSVIFYSVLLSSIQTAGSSSPDALSYNSQNGSSGGTSGERKEDPSLPLSAYKRVAVVENFYDIIYNVHVEMDGRSGKHAGQKRTYRAVSHSNSSSLYISIDGRLINMLFLSVSTGSREVCLPAKRSGNSFPHVLFRLSEENASSKYNYGPHLSNQCSG